MHRSKRVCWTRVGLFLLLFAKVSFCLFSGPSLPPDHLYLRRDSGFGNGGLRVTPMQASMRQPGVVRPLAHKEIDVDLVAARRLLDANRAYIQNFEARLCKPPAGIDVPAILYMPTEPLPVPIVPARDERLVRRALAERRAVSEGDAAALGTFDDGQYLSGLASSYKARADALGYSKFFGKVLRDRAAACQIAALNPCVHFGVKSVAIPTGFVEQFPELASFGKLDGNLAQRRLYSELSYCIDAAFQQYRGNGTDQFSGIAPTVLHLATTARYAHDPAVGFHLADSCFYLLEAGNYLSLLGRGVKTGVKNFAEHALQLAKSIAAHPWDTTKELFYNSIKLAGQALGVALLLSNDNPSPHVRKAQFALLDKAIDVAHSAYHEPEAAIAVVTEMLLGQLAFGYAHKLCKVGIASAGKALREAAQAGHVLEDTRRAFLRMMRDPLPVPIGISVAEYESSLAGYEALLRADADLQKFASTLKAGSEQEKIFAAGGAAAEQLAKENSLLNPAAAALREGLEQVVEAKAYWPASEFLTTLLKEIDPGTKALLQSLPRSPKTSIYVAQLERSGCYEMALNDFDSLCLANVRAYANGAKVGELAGRWDVSVRPHSRTGPPTLAFYDAATECYVKIRYIA